MELCLLGETSPCPRGHMNPVTGTYFPMGSSTQLDQTPPLPLREFLFSRGAGLKELEGQKGGYKVQM